MCTEKIEQILNTYEPVEDKPGYVWFSKANRQIVAIDVLRSAYEDFFKEKVGEINADGNITRPD